MAQHSFTGVALDDSPPRAPPSSAHASPTFVMPDVVVHPPEEDQGSHHAPFLAFAAANAAARPPMCFSSPELNTIATRLEMWQQYTHGSPAPDRRVSRPSALGLFSPPMKRCNAVAGYADVDMTDDVIEVVKVPRAHHTDDVGVRRMPPKRGLGARLRSSLRVVSGGGGTRKENSLARKDSTGARKGTAAATMPRPAMPPPVESPASLQAHTLRRSRSARLARPLAQLFAFGSSSSIASEGCSASPVSSADLASTVRMPVDEEEEQLRSASTILNIDAGASMSARRNFSFSALQSLFAVPTSSLSTSVPMLTRTSSETETSSEPHTPDDDDADDTAVLDFSLASIPPFEAAAGPQDGGLSARKGGGPDAADTSFSFDAHLDSLYFEQLSFDADDFDINR